MVETEAFEMDDVQARQPAERRRPHRRLMQRRGGGRGRRLLLVQGERLGTDHERFRSVCEAVVWLKRRSGLVAGTSVRPWRARREGRVSGAGVDVAPEGVDAGVELVRDLLEGLMGFAGHDLEERVRDLGGNGSTEARRQDDVELPGDDERWGGDAREAVGRVMRKAGVDLRLEGVDGLLVGEGQRLADDLAYGAVGVRARRVDPGEECVEEGALARRDLRQPSRSRRRGRPGPRACAAARRRRRPWSRPTAARRAEGCVPRRGCRTPSRGSGR
jgi:hypothetical protein